MLRKLICLLAAAMMALSLFGCGETVEPTHFTEETEAPAEHQPGGDVIPAEEEPQPTEAPTRPAEEPAASPESHTHRWTQETVFPTCTAPGWSAHSCACGVTEVDGYIEATGHSFGPWTTLTEPTSDRTGQAERACVSCGQKEYRTLEKLPAGHTHSYTMTVTLEPTCGAAGEKTFLCACGDTYTDQIPRGDHSYSTETVSATCTRMGYDVHTCAICGNTYRDNYTEQLPHDDVAVETPATCTTGSYVTFTCRVCGDTTVGHRGPSLGGHKWSKWVVTKEATESSAGTKERSCTVCGEKQTDTVPVKEHTHSYTASVTGPTCTLGGYTVHTCACGDTYTDSETEATGHSWGQWKTVREATESSAGSKERTCTACGARETGNIPALGHTHEYTDTVTQPTCTEGGYTTRTCACGYSYTYRETAARGHSLTHTKKKPTCDRQGYTLHECCKCEFSYKDTYVSALGHIWGEWITVTEPTETSTGRAGRICDRCNSVEYKTLDVLPHTHDFATIVGYRNATCKAEGYVTKACSCGETRTETLPMAHDWVHKHTDEVGHYDARIVCHCGWSCSAEGDYVRSFAAHVESLDAEERYYHSYYEKGFWIVDAPARDWEECSACGAVK